MTNSSSTAPSTTTNIFATNHCIEPDAAEIRIGYLRMLKSAR